MLSYYDILDMKARDKRNGYPEGRGEYFACEAMELNKPKYNLN